MEEEEHKEYYEYSDDENDQSSSEFRPYSIRFTFDKEEVLLIWSSVTKQFEEFISGHQLTDELEALDSMMSEDI